MKTKQQVIKDNQQYAKLIRAVVNNIGKESISDVNNHGISSGFGGFIYYSDTVKFFNKHKKDILAMAEDVASQLGEDMLSMIQNFSCLGSGGYKNRKPDYTQTEIAEAIFAGRGESATQIKNAMSWFAAEEVCRIFED